MDQRPIDQAIQSIERALELIDAHNFGVGAAPHLDLGRARLVEERDQPKAATHSDR